MPQRTAWSTSIWQEPVVYILWGASLDLRVKRPDPGVNRGRFGADMKVTLVNDGPVTIVIDSRLRE